MYGQNFYKEILGMMERRNIDILNVKETKWNGSNGGNV